MNLFKKVHDLLLGIIPHGVRKTHLFFFGLLAIALPITILLTKQIQDTRQRASENIGFTGVPNIDPLTNELYDINVWGTPATKIINDNYYADISFKISGSRVKNIPSLFGVRQKDNTFEKLITFTRRQDGEYVEFNTENPVTTWQGEQGCIDLYSSSNFEEKSYIASFCYKPLLFSSSPKKQEMWSVNGSQNVSFTYDYRTPSFVLTIQSAHFKQNGQYHQHFVNFFGYDSTVPADSFKNVIFEAQWLLFGLLNNSSTQLCKLENTYFKTSSNVKPEGGSNVAATRYGNGGCSFEYDSPAFLPHYQSLDTRIVPGGYFAYLYTLTNTPTPGLTTPTPTPGIFPSITQYPSPTLYPLSPTPTTNTSCKIGISKIEFTDAYYCGESSFKHITYWCQDGYNAIQGADNGCYTASQLIEFAQKACAGRSSCKTTPTPTYVQPTTAKYTPTPTYGVKYTPTPSPSTTGYVYAITTPGSQTIKIYKVNSNNSATVAVQSTGKISQTLQPGKYYVSFTLTSRTLGVIRTPQAKSFTIERGKTTSIVGDFSRGTTTISTK